MHTSYGPVMARDRAKGGCVGRQTAHIHTFFTCMYRGLLSDGLGLVFHNRHVSATFLLVGNNSETVIYAVGSCLDYSMTEFGTFRVRIQWLMLLEPVFHSVTQRRLVGLEPYEKIATFLPDFFVLLSAKFFLSD